MMAILLGMGCKEQPEAAQPLQRKKSLEAARVSAADLDSSAQGSDILPPSEVVPQSDFQQQRPTSQAILAVKVSGATSSDGVYFCALFDDAEKFAQRKDPVLSERFPASQDHVVWTIGSLPPGEYSIAVFHDANENGVLDRHALGFPTEAYGFSHNARGKFGPPPYAKIKFAVGSDPQELQIHLK